MRTKRYKDKKWLEKQAISKKLSTRKIGRIEGVDAETIRHWMIKFEIPRQYCVPTGINHVQLNEEATEFLTGELLGDASIIWGHKPTSAYYSLTSKHEAYLKWIESKLLSFGIKRRGTLKSYKNKYAEYWILQSKYYRSGMPELRRLWYPDEKKIVPRNIRLTPLITKIWFIEDGSLFKRKRRRGDIALNLCTNGFNKEDTDRLAMMLQEILGEKSIHVNKAGKGKGYLIVITKERIIRKFINYIGDCPKEIESIYGYKWNAISKNHNLNESSKALNITNPILRLK